jgi:hypothetical protein
MAAHSLERIGDVCAYRRGMTRANFDFDAPSDLLRHRHRDLAFHTFILPLAHERHRPKPRGAQSTARRSVGRLEAFEHREVLQVRRLEIRVEVLRERGNDRMEDPGLRRCR